MEIPIEFCVSARAYKAAPTRRIFLASLLIALYAAVIPYCYLTAGEPRKAAMISAQKIADEKWASEALTVEKLAGENGTLDDAATNSTDASDLYDALPSLSSQPRSGSGEDEDLTAGFDANPLSKMGSVPGAAPEASGMFSGWFGPTKEQKKAQAEFEKWQKQFTERSPDGSISLPPAYLPSAWACLALFSTLTLHALFFLLCHWIVEFKALSLFAPAKKVDVGCFILVKPPANRGKSAMVIVQKAKSSGYTQIEFQRQTYIYTPGARLGAQAKQYPNGVFTLAVCPTSQPLTDYINAVGITTDTEVDRVTERWGKNHLAVTIPSFLELLQQQLLSPLAIFQVFCALLWLLDEYWTFTLWSLASVVMFEGTTVFQRTRTQKMLGGMAPKPSPIYVLRCGKWLMLTTRDLLPGDLISLAFKRRGGDANKQGGASAVTEVPSSSGSTSGASATTSAKTAAASPSVPLTGRDEVVPCDCLLLTGAAVVNEASLTGESVPQMKEAVAKDLAGASAEGDGGDVTLDMNGLHRVHTLFSGTSVVTINANTPAGGDSGHAAASDENVSVTHAHTSREYFRPGVPYPPDGGAIAYVLRTGFSSSQGTLLQMIEFSQQTVSGDGKETGLALLMLFVFALIAAGYVLKEGLRKKEKTTHELLLKCVMIITSVVPRQLPMQMAMAVNMALMALTKSGLFCTEPYRVPMAGKVSHCLFDKTGTLTTDQLVPVGVISASNPSYDEAPEASVSSGSSASANTKRSDLPKLTTVSTSSGNVAMVLAACHSLVVVEDLANASKKSSTSAGDEDDAVGENDVGVEAQATPQHTLVGDPIELAAIKGVEWTWDAENSTATPGSWQTMSKALDVVRMKLSDLRAAQSQAPRQAAPGAPPNRLALNSQQQNAQIEALTKDAVTLEGKITDAKRKALTAPYKAVQVVQRHHFSSQLQRMSVVVKCVRGAGFDVFSNEHRSIAGKGKSAVDWFSLVKGSPEAIYTLCDPANIPSWYKSTYESMARRGLRVLALACRLIDPSSASSSGTTPKDLPRASVESNLTFCGFIAFECKIRADSKIVVKSLRESDHMVSMLTGDALLTSLHVAKEVDICDLGRPTLTLQAQKSVAFDANDGTNVSSTAPDAPHWLYRQEDAAGGCVEKIVPFDISTISQLAKSHDLLTTEKDLLAVVEKTGGEKSKLWESVGYFKVFARMSPQGKASIIRSVQNSPVYNDAHVLMCGDGGNDVGALKQANVGLALLAGHANANTTDGGATGKGGEGKGEAKDAKSAEDALNEHQKAVAKRSDAFNAMRAAHMKEFQKKQQAKGAEDLQKKIAEVTEKGEWMSMFSVMKDHGIKLKKDLEMENKRFMAIHGHVWDPKDGDGLGGSGGGTGLDGLMAQLDSGDAAGGMGGLPMVRPGDASVAAPFTSRTPSIKAVVDLIRQGRCTLLSALMQQEIMMLESCIAAYTLSALTLNNARSSERQMMASSWLIMTAAVSFSYATPLDKMHPLRPLRSLFHPAIIFSILGQAVIHIGCMTLAVKWATDAMGEEKLAEVTEFFRKAKAKEIDRYALCDEDDYVCTMNAFWTAPFMPNLLNSVVFLVETSQMISVFFANYKGRPWMAGIIDNHPLFLSVYICIAGVVVASWEMVPQLNELIQLAPFPDDMFRYKVVALVMATIAGTFMWDRLCTMLFAPKVFSAMMNEAKGTKPSDLLPVVMTAGKIVAGVALISTGNVLLIIGGVWYYRSYMNKKKGPVAAPVLA
jgi:cation-transporting ATPase 13A1